MKRNPLMKLAVVAVAVATLIRTALADPNYLIKIDVSDINSVTFTATTNFASANDNTTQPTYGASLLNFFNTTNGQGFAISGSLFGADNASRYSAVSANTAGVDFGIPGVDLDFYDSGNTDTQTFSTSQVAFRGMGAVDFSSISSYLPSAGATGDIIAGSGGQPGAIIGQWEVVSPEPTPEPGTLALAGLGGAGALLMARRKK